jgi:GTP cyclohydrolase IA
VPADANPDMTAPVPARARLEPLHVAPESETAAAASAPDLPRAGAAARELLLALGADLEDESLRETSRRMAAALADLLTPEPFEATTFPNDGGYDEMVVARAIPFHSLCEHHLLPFHGVAHIGYLPGERIIGLSKLGRLSTSSRAASRSRSA